MQVFTLPLMLVASMALSSNHGVLAAPLVLEARNELTAAAKGLERTLSGSGSHQAEVGLVERPSSTSPLAHDHDHQPAAGTPLVHGPDGSVVPKKKPMTWQRKAKIFGRVPDQVQWTLMPFGHRSADSPFLHCMPFS
ncbi:hypothetical protein IE81DRAFT_8098 [Ceraceosorus guamensis]|uniref:Uncharacterized protein n=1 Tax=Ceraceosorus guamensis TaxID=1522189 RepID=A0A316W9C6_9BASI|nr:hypothetical protein IE81DRAFT_8098 [Ceraceosorus guamensis]PWN46432.1 hypothetical protein IE81DRAFT_8098 [Ceraceosorus guamensis]